MREHAAYTVRSANPAVILAAALVVLLLSASGCVRDVKSRGGRDRQSGEERGMPMLVVDPDPKGTNVREVPGGKVVTVIPGSGRTDDEIYMRRVIVTAQRDEWLQVRLDDGTYGWMHRSVLGARVAPDSGGAAMRAKPEAGASVVATLKGGSTLALLEVKGGWAKAQYGAASGKKITGWVEGRDLSADPYEDLPAFQASAPASMANPKKKPAAPKGEAPKRAAAPKNVPPEKNGAQANPAGVSGKQLVKSVLQYQGVKYVWGGTTPKGFDCSGLMYYVCKQHDITIPRTSAEQAKAGRAVAKKDLKAGDMVFFGRSSSGPVDHVGMYIGNDTYVHAPNPEYPVMKTRLSDNSFVENGRRYVFQGKYVTARRVAD